MLAHQGNVPNRTKIEHQPRKFQVLRAKFFARTYYICSKHILILTLEIVKSMDVKQSPILSDLPLSLLLSFSFSLLPSCHLDIASPMNISVFVSGALISEFCENPFKIFAE